MIEAKEGCKLTRRRVTLARLTYQRFFPRYRHLSGMTGTASEVAGELWSVYGLPVDRAFRRIGRHAACGCPIRCCRMTPRKWRRVAAHAAALQARRRPVLIGTRTVAAAEHASRALTALGLPHAVLSAAQDAAEADGRRRARAKPGGSRSPPTWPDAARISEFRPRWPPPAGWR